MSDEDYSYGISNVTGESENAELAKELSKPTDNQNGQDKSWGKQTPDRGFYQNILGWLRRTKLYKKLLYYSDLLTNLENKINKLVGKKKDFGITGLEEDDSIITEKSEIASILMQAANETTPVEVSFGNRMIVYSTSITLSDGSIDPITKKIEPSSQYLNNGRYILISGLNPDDGDEKLQNTKQNVSVAATFQFLLNDKFNEFYVRYIGTATCQPANIGVNPHDIEEDRPHAEHKLDFPDTLYCKKQRRNSIRFAVHDGTYVYLHVERPAHEVFDAKLLDISDGGLCYSHPIDIAPLAEYCELIVTLTWPPDNSVTLSGTVLSVRPSLEGTNIHLSYNIDSYEKSRQTGELVKHVELFVLS